MKHCAFFAVRIECCSRIVQYGLSRTHWIQQLHASQRDTVFKLIALQQLDAALIFVFNHFKVVT
jgi:hypothetical protein